MTQPNRLRAAPRIHAYAASFGDDLAYECIHESSEGEGIVLDPFVGSGTTALQSLLSNRNAIGIDVDPIACRISRVLTSRFNVPYLVDATEWFQERLRKFEIILASEPRVYRNLGPGSTFEIDSTVFCVPDQPAIAYWFDPSHMATLSVVRETAACEPDPLVRQVFEVALSSSIVRKWPNTLSYAMDIDHSRPHKPKIPRAQPIKSQFALVYRVLSRVRDTIVDIQEELEVRDVSARILEGDSACHLPLLSSDSIDFVLTSPPYLNAIDYPRAHKFSQWWLSPQTLPLGRSEYLGLRQATDTDIAEDRLSMTPALTDLIAPFRDMAVYRSISRYIVDLAAVIEELQRVVRVGAKVIFVVADNVIGGTRFPVSAIIEELFKRNGFSSVLVNSRTIKNTRRRYPFGVNGFVSTMKDEYLVTGVKAAR